MTSGCASGGAPGSLSDGMELLFSAAITATVPSRAPSYASRSGRKVGEGMWQAVATMAAPQASDILGHVTLVTGPEEFLNQRTVTAAIAAVRRADPESEVSRTTADQVSMAGLADLASPSLFSSVRCVVVGGLEGLPEDAYDGLVQYAGSPAED